MVDTSSYVASHRRLTLLPIVWTVYWFAPRFSAIGNSVLFDVYGSISLGCLWMVSRDLKIWRQKSVASIWNWRKSDEITFSLSRKTRRNFLSLSLSVSLYLRHKHKIYQTHTRLAAVVVLVIGLSSLLSISRIVRLAWLLFLYLPIWPKLINTLYLFLSLTLKNIHTIYTFTNTKQLLLSPSLCCSKYLPPSLSSFSFVSHGPSYETVWPDWATFEVTWRHILLQN